eukprot:jgi/Galph1/5305/GphlegSOOS_G3939.1
MNEKTNSLVCCKGSSPYSTESGEAISGSTLESNDTTQKVDANQVQQSTNSTAVSDMKRQKRLLRNRLSAERSRQRRLSRIQELQRENERLKSEIEALIALKEQNNFLKRQIEVKRRYLEVLYASTQSEAQFSGFGGSYIPPFSDEAKSVHSEVSPVQSPPCGSFTSKGCQRSPSALYQSGWFDTNPQLLNANSIGTANLGLGFEATWLEQAAAARDVLSKVSRTTSSSASTF